MRAGYICVAGVDLESGQHVRPVLSGAKQLSTTLLARNAGPFEMGVIVDLGTVTPVGQKPEVEDHLFDPSQCTALRVVGPRSFWKLLGEHAKPTLREIFGPDLMKRGASSCAVDVGKGDASLGCFGP